MVTLAKDEAEWLQAIELALGEDGSAASARLAVARASDWDALVEQIAQLFASTRPAKSQQPLPSEPESQRASVHRSSFQ